MMVYGHEIRKECKRWQNCFMECCSRIIIYNDRFQDRMHKNHQNYQLPVPSLTMEGAHWAQPNLCLSGQVVRLLLQAGADKDKLTRSNGWTPLHCAAWNGRLDVVRVLLEAGARKNPLTEDGLSPLRLASDNGQEAIKALFLEFGVDAR